MRRRLLPSKLSGIVWCSVLAATGALTWFFHGDSTGFRGISEDSKQVVSCEAAVKIESIHVQPGRVVHPGDTLVRASDPELSMHIAEILHAIEDASGDANINKAESRRRIGQLQTEFRARRAGFQGEIRTLEEQRARNQRLVSGFREMGQATPDTSTSALQDRIAALRQQERVEEEGMASQVALLEGTKDDMTRLASSRKEALKAELALLRLTEARLTIRSGTEGVVDSVNFRTGENVQAFKPIVTISSHRPALVRGYIPEKIRASLAVGDTVAVMAVGMGVPEVKGCIAGLGSRIAELPRRLWKLPNFPVWGREVIVAIPPDNPLLLGEMVEVRRDKPGLAGWLR